MPKTQTTRTGFAASPVFAAFIVFIVAAPTVILTCLHGTAKTVGFCVYLIGLLAFGAAVAAGRRQRDTE